MGDKLKGKPEKWEEKQSENAPFYKVWGVTERLDEYENDVNQKL